MHSCIVVSGGDAPGINAAMDSFVRLARANGDQVLGARGGLGGLLDDRVLEIDAALLTLLAGRGGSLLQSSRAPALQESDARARLQAAMGRHDIDNLLLFGGDGTIRHVAPLLADWGISCITLPTTIDNDVAGTDYTLGHDSACNFRASSGHRHPRDRARPAGAHLHAGDFGRAERSPGAGNRLRQRRSPGPCCPSTRLNATGWQIA